MGPTLMRTGTPRQASHGYPCLPTISASRRLPRRTPRTPPRCQIRRLTPTSPTARRRCRTASLRAAGRRSGRRWPRPTAGLPPGRRRATRLRSRLRRLAMTPVVPAARVIRPVTLDRPLRRRLGKRRLGQRRVRQRLVRPRRAPPPQPQPRPRQPPPPRRRRRAPDGRCGGMPTLRRSRPRRRNPLVPLALPVPPGLLGLPSRPVRTQDRRTRRRRPYPATRQAGPPISPLAPRRRAAGQPRACPATRAPSLPPGRTAAAAPARPPSGSASRPCGGPRGARHSSRSPGWSHGRS